MVEAILDGSFEAWQERARALLASSTPPERVLWIVPGSQGMLPVASEPPPAPAKRSVRVPRRFVDLARLAACHRAADRWSVMYRVVWRLVHERRDLLDDPLDADVASLQWLVQSVRSDVHRMQAFVRFRRIGSGTDERLVAWHAPDHDIAALVAPYFSARYPDLRWSIFTPQASVHWADGVLTRGDGVPASALPSADTEEAAETLWRVYYAAAFNPARLNEPKLRREMPERFWASLPEARDIPELMAAAPVRVGEMRSRSGGVTNRAAVPDTRSLAVLREAAAACRSCALCERATQTVFGEGDPSASLVLVGEQPGDQEDRIGRPFVGPAGEVLDRALAQAGIDRTATYLTNAVKHFGWEPRGKWRIHRTPRMSEVLACRPWLEHEMSIVAPRTVVCLGGVAARALLGPQARVSALRGRILPSPWAPRLIVTYHPSAVLRASDPETQARTLDLLVADLRLASSSPLDGAAAAAR